MGKHKSKFKKKMIHSLDDYKKKTDKNKKGQEFYTGGEKSGLAVQDPNAKDLINQASEFSKENPDAKGNPNAKITLYANGFIIDDGEFRDFSNPENKKIMAQLKEGKIPRGLLKASQDQNLDIGVEDRTKENYVPPPPPAYVAFDGQATTFGGDKLAMQSGKINTNIAAPKFDESKPTTQLAIEYYNGEKERIKVNKDTLFDTVHSYIGQKAPVVGRYEVLKVAMPPQQIPDAFGKTLEAIKLVNCRIIQRICD